MHGGAILGAGSFGCVFRPAINCKQGKKNNKKVSKIFFGTDSEIDCDNEFELSKFIKKIDPRNEWSYKWDIKCKSPPYDKIYKQNKNISICLENANIDIDRFNKTSYMLIGEYAGKVINETRETAELRSCYENVNKFKIIFFKIMRSVKPLFHGLNELYKNKISHMDINRNNMTLQLDDKLFRYIDFGLSSKFSEIDKYENRSKTEFGWERIYPPYPLEFIYLFAPKKLLEEELEDINSGIYRTGFEMYLLIHELVFDRKDIKKNQIELLNSMILKKPSKTKILHLLDTYSLGMFIARMLLEVKPDYISKSQFKKLLNEPEVGKFINLFKMMAEPNASKRIMPQEAYDKYLELEKKYLLD